MIIHSMAVGLAPRLSRFITPAKLITASILCDASINKTKMEQLFKSYHILTYYIYYHQGKQIFSFFLIFSFSNL